MLFKEITVFILRTNVKSVEITSGNCLKQNLLKVPSFSNLQNFIWRRRVKSPKRYYLWEMCSTKLVYKNKYQGKGKEEVVLVFN
jgi:hypothetical protein